MYRRDTKQLSKYVRNPSVRFSVFLIDAYRAARLVFGRHEVCVFEKTCSLYARDVFLENGFLMGAYFSIKRIMRCHPWNKDRVVFSKN